MGDKSGIQWRQIQDVPGYQVSDIGQVRRAIPGTSTRVGRMLKPQVNEDGYLHLMIRRKKLKIHTAVLTAFVGPRPEGHEARHLDDDKANNRLWNLRWGTRQQNVDDKIRNGRQPRGERHYSARLTEADVREIRIRVCGLSLRALGVEYGVSHTAIRRAANGATWGHVHE